MLNRSRGESDESEGIRFFDRYYDCGWLTEKLIAFMLKLKGFKPAKRSIFDKYIWMGYNTSVVKKMKIVFL